MKKVLLTLAMGCFLGINLWGQSISNEVSASKPTKELSVTASNSPLRADQAVVDVMACEPGRVVHDRAYAIHDGYTGQIKSDQACSDGTYRAYQSFKDCKYKIDGLTFYGMFEHWVYPGDHEYGKRSCMDDNFDMIKPITVEVAFYTDNNGMPGEEVYWKEIDVIGERLPILWVNYSTYKEPSSCFYRFYVDLGEELALYNGWFSVTAVDKQEDEYYWLHLLGAHDKDGSHNDEDGRCLVESSSYGMVGTSSPLIYCFHGNGDLIVGGKALKLCRFLSINNSQTSSNKYEKVQVEIENVGGTVLNDATLALYVDNIPMGEETLPISIPVGEVRHYTFRARADLSGYGYHTIKVENHTPGDAGISTGSLQTTLMHPQPGMVCDSHSTVFLDYCAIKRVRIGDIDNESEASASGYNDFTHISTDIAPGETLPLTVEPGDEYNIGVWVDWNDNGVFDDAGEFVALDPSGKFNISIPTISGLRSGPHVMRIVMSGTSKVVACGTYQAGETEDYTLNVVLHDDDPIMKPEISEIDFHASEENPVKEFVLSIGNDGGDDLEVSARIDYTLPLLPLKKSTNVKSADLPDIQIKSAPILAKESGNAVKFMAPATDQEDVFTLRYDSGAENTISVGNYESAVYGHYYPADVLRSVKGMKVTSMDFFIGELPTSAAIEIYGPNSQTISGPCVYKQSFTPKAAGWNHVVLDTPFEITGTDLWLGVRLDGSAGGYYMGIDGSTAIQGYGDMLNVGNNQWWSLTELGMKHNVCVRATLSGDRTPEISWLSLDQKDFTVEPSGNVDVKVTLDASKLETAFYEAAIVLSSNDLLSPEYTIPVYMANGILNAINTIDATRVGVKMIGNDLVLESASLISSVNVYDLNGALVEHKAVNEYCSVVGLGNLAAGVYVINITYGDGATESIKAGIMK